ncbi:MAG: flagellar export protein FliJ [Dehalococcoidia bacterium]|nr:flagellar export protein FliJ [Dehalococcoidia bacterium]
MAKRFKLEPLLNHKKRLEDLQQQRLSRLRQEHQHQRELLTSLETRADEQVEALARANEGSIDPLGVQMRLAFIDRVQEDVEKQQVVVEAAHEQVEDSRATLVGLLKEKRILERLKENDAIQAAAEAKRLDAALVDELSMTRFSHRQEAS